MTKAWALEVVVRPHELRERVSQWRRKGERIAFVPTMGNLHAGHGSLVSRASSLAEHVIVSIFVNPLQFGPNEDFSAYPRTPEDDKNLLRSLQVELLFAPEVPDIYPEGQETTARVHVPGLEDILCGAFRPGHFMGVATVVTKLLNLVQPDVALFGEKDFQQLMVIRRAATDLCMPVEIIGVPTTREADGLAMSSRNRHLNAEERSLAPSLYRALEEASRRVLSGERSAASIARAAAATMPQSDALRLEYLEIVDPATMQPVDDITAPVRVAGALWVGSTRLIDNVLV